MIGIFVDDSRLEKAAKLCLALEKAEGVRIQTLRRTTYRGREFGPDRCLHDAELLAAATTAAYRLKAAGFPPYGWGENWGADMRPVWVGHGDARRRANARNWREFMRA